LGSAGDAPFQQREDLQIAAACRTVEDRADLLGELCRTGSAGAGVLLGRQGVALSRPDRAVGQTDLDARDALLTFALRRGKSPGLLMEVLRWARQGATTDGGSLDFSRDSRRVSVRHLGRGPQAAGVRAPGGVGATVFGWPRWFGWPGVNLGLLR